MAQDTITLKVVQMPLEEAPKDKLGETSLTTMPSSRSPLIVEVKASRQDKQAVEKVYGICVAKVNS